MIFQKRHGSGVYRSSWYSASGISCTRYWRSKAAQIMVEVEKVGPSHGSDVDQIIVLMSILTWTKSWT